MALKQKNPATGGLCWFLTSEITHPASGVRNRRDCALWRLSSSMAFRILGPQSMMIRKLVCIYQNHARTLNAHTSCVNALAFSSLDGRFLASGGDGASVCCSPAELHDHGFCIDLNINLWDLHEERVSTPCCSFKGPIVILACPNFLLRTDVIREIFLSCRFRHTTGLFSRSL